MKVKKNKFLKNLTRLNSKNIFPFTQPVIKNLREKKFKPKAFIPIEIILIN